jgi:hypothetical protein
MNPVAYPVLVDNLFPRDAVLLPAAEPFTTQVTLPDETCESCTLQVIQFMAQHGPGYFYHHCANVRIVAADAELPEDDDPATGSTGSANAGEAGSPSSAQPAAAGGAAGTGAAGTGAAPAAAGTSAAGTGAAPAAGGVADDDDTDDGGCSVASRKPAGISRALMSVFALLGIASLWRGRRHRR